VGGFLPKHLDHRESSSGHVVHFAELQVVVAAAVKAKRTNALLELFSKPVTNRIQSFLVQQIEKSEPGLAKLNEVLTIVVLFDGPVDYALRCQAAEASVEAGGKARVVMVNLAAEVSCIDFRNSFWNIQFARLSLPFQNLFQESLGAKSSDRTPYCLMAVLALEFFRNLPR